MRISKTLATGEIPLILFGAGIDELGSFFAKRDDMTVLPHMTVGVITVLLGMSINIGQAERPLTFEQDIRPILKAQCFHCHGESGEREGGLNLRLVRLMRIGGDSGPAIESDEAASSIIWDRISTDEMPEGPKKLSAEQKQLIYRWLEQGAQTLRARQR